MKNQKQVALELIGKHVAAYRTMDVSLTYSDRLGKAELLLVAGHVQRQADGSYTVQGSRKEPYLVNGACECEDYKRNAPKGWCKHRIAAKLHRLTLHDLEEIRRAGIPHLHFVCEHKSLMELCWQAECPEPMDQLCDACLRECDAVDARYEVVSDGAATLPPTTLSPAELAALAEPRYEPAPKLPCKRKTSRMIPMPEAPASLNLKLRLPGGHELMYTARSMKRGDAGDQELLERLPFILQALEELGCEDEPLTGPSWLRRLGQLCKLSHGRER